MYSFMCCFSSLEPRKKTLSRNIISANINVFCYVFCFSSLELIGRKKSKKSVVQYKLRGGIKNNKGQTVTESNPLQEPESPSPAILTLELPWPLDCLDPLTALTRNRRYKPTSLPAGLEGKYNSACKSIALITHATTWRPVEHEALRALWSFCTLECKQEYRPLLRLCPCIALNDVVDMRPLLRLFPCIALNDVVDMLPFLRLFPCIHYCVAGISLCLHPRWGTTDAEIKDPSGGSLESCQRLLLSKPAVGCSFACCACWQGFPFLPTFCLPDSFNFTPTPPPPPPPPPFPPPPNFSDLYSEMSHK